MAERQVLFYPALQERPAKRRVKVLRSWWIVLAADQVPVRMSQVLPMSAVPHFSTI